MDQTEKRITAIAVIAILAVFAGLIALVIKYPIDGTCLDTPTYAVEGDAITLCPPREPVYKCLTHGIINYANESNFAIYIDDEKVTNVCIRCLSNLINEHIPQLAKIDPNN